MNFDSVFFKAPVCFTANWAGFGTIKPLNVVVGRNNSGKSHLLNLIQELCANRLADTGSQTKYRATLDEESLQEVFKPGSFDTGLSGEPWPNHGRLFVGAEVEWEFDAEGRMSTPTFSPGFESSLGPRSERDDKTRRLRITSLLERRRHGLVDKAFRRLLADRDISPEESERELDLTSDGGGASNIVRRFITSADPQLRRELVEEELLDALNRVFGSDGTFTEIRVQEHDYAGATAPQGYWEICLREEAKGLVPLGRSGSGLKTVLLVLLNLLVIPEVQGRPKSEFVFGFEELENNLHPSILRRLLDYLEEYAVNEECPVFLTTHSSVALDFFATSEHAQIVHVTHDGKSARTSTVSAHFDLLSVVSELGSRPSDLLQANGVLWLEGPSDRVYLNRWIDLVTDGALREGRDYQCAFYGGSLLARDQFRAPEEADAGLANLFQINPNVVVVCDSDKWSRRAPLKARIRRIKDEVEATPRGHIWVTDTREIENYIPGPVLAGALRRSKLPDPEQWENFYPRKGARRPSYLERWPKRKSVDKVDLAVACAPRMTAEVMAERFGWLEGIGKIVDCIRSWSV